MIESPERAKQDRAQMGTQPQLYSTENALPGFDVEDRATLWVRGWRKTAAR